MSQSLGLLLIIVDVQRIDDFPIKRIKKSRHFHFVVVFRKKMEPNKSKTETEIKREKKNETKRFFFAVDFIQMTNIDLFFVCVQDCYCLKIKDKLK